MPLVAWNGILPQLHPSTFVAPNSYITGDVTVGSDVTFLFGAVARGDILPIRVGRGSNLQEHAVLHTSHGLTPCVVGEDVTVGHAAIVHGATVGNRCIIGMGAVILDGAEIGDDCIIGAQSLVTMNTIVPPRSMVFGSPAKVVRTLTAGELQQLLESAESYQHTGRAYAATLGRGW